MTKKPLTNEVLMKHFDNAFEVCLYAIDIAQRLIKAGQTVELGQLLEDIKRNPEHFEIEEPLDSEEING